MVDGWNLVSAPINLSKQRIGNFSVVGDPIPTNRSDCILSILRYTNSTDWDKLDRKTWGYDPATNDQSFTMLETNRAYWLEVNGTCTVKYLGIAQAYNLTRELAVDWYIGSLANATNVTLPTNNAPSLFKFDKSNVMKYLYRYNEDTDRFEITVLYGTWGWWPSSANRNFINIQPTRGYYMDIDVNANWTYAP